MISNSASTRPFVLRRPTPIPGDTLPSSNEFYDPHLQIWISRKHSRPLVSIKSENSSSEPTEFGETVITETREGIDQMERIVGADDIRASDFGETVLTKTREVIDQSEGTR
jgi:hypothetical protein